jgi:hypothetical protein
MFTLREIYIYITQLAENQLRDYYGICCENLKALNKRSNLISFFIVVIGGFYCFSDSIKKISFLGFDIDQKSILSVSPLLLSYFILEWCLIARRRRELMKIIKHIGLTVFKINSGGVTFIYPYFNLFSRSIMPFSFLIELINVDISSKMLRWLNFIFIVALFIIIPFFISYTLFISFTKYALNWQTVICNSVAAFCLIQIVLFYVSEIRLMIQVNKDDTIFLYQMNNPPPQNNPSVEEQA